MTNDNNQCIVIAITTKDEDVSIEITYKQLIRFEYTTPIFDPDTEVVYILLQRD